MGYRHKRPTLERDAASASKRSALSSRKMKRPRRSAVSVQCSRLPDAFIAPRYLECHRRGRSQRGKQRKSERGGNIAAEGGAGHLARVEIGAQGHHRARDEACFDKSLLATEGCSAQHFVRQVEPDSAILLHIIGDDSQV